ncbi:hypothetical protein E2C01_033877 [Portunus trituberculatus]|uniref:Uncharacterized protein n=1 Tax=Portunus trituberculatus TaxID=210409 RepID=A0A5B7EZ22_PORTR|nr:hypothetical protein [Portunus trituberculatus]
MNWVKWVRVTSAGLFFSVSSLQPRCDERQSEPQPPPRGCPRESQSWVKTRCNPSYTYVISKPISALPGDIHLSLVNLPANCQPVWFACRSGRSRIGQVSPASRSHCPGPAAGQETRYTVQQTLTYHHEPPGSGDRDSSAGSTNRSFVRAASADVSE